MIGSMTPFRISFGGGGSDLPAFYKTHPGCVLSATINKYMYLFVHPSFDDKTQVKYSKTELVEDVASIRHPIVRETLKEFELSGVDISSIADVPAGTGLGSSSAFTVGLFNALYGYTNDRPSKERLARDACRLEIEVLGEPIGKQDQYAAAYGGLNLITFREDESVIVEPIEMQVGKFRELQENLLMFFTGSTRNARDILRDQRQNLSNHRERNNLVRMTELATQLRDSAVSGSIDDFGMILDECWHLKKSLSNKISGDEIDSLYRIARENGALGGKLLGAGGGGFLLFYSRVEDQERLRKALGALREMPFEIDHAGTRLILNSGSTPLLTSHSL